MARAHEIAIGADAQAFDQGIRSGVIEPLELAEKALEDMADAADDAGRDGARGIDRLEDALKDAQRETKKLGDAGDRAGDEVRRGMRRAEDGMEEFGREAESTAKESAASFDGSAESIVDAFQEVAANALGGFGPAGVVAGLAAAAGIGLAVSGFEAVNEEQEKSKERAAAWAQAFIEAGGRVLSNAQTVAKGLEIFGDPELYATAKTNAEDWGVQVSVAVAAMSGEMWALDAVQASLTDRQDKLNKALETTQVSLDGTIDGYADVTASINDGKDAFSRLTGEMAAGATQADEYSQYLTAVAENTANATSKVDEFGDTVYALPDGTQVYIDAETRQATSNVDAIEKKIYSIPDGHSTVRVAADQAQRDLDGFVTRNSGREIHIKGRVISGGSFE